MSTARATGDADLWRHRTARPVRTGDRVVLVVLASAGTVAVLRFFDWWFRAEHAGDPALFVALSLAVWYGISRIVLNWVNVVAARTPAPVPAPVGSRVAIFTTSAPGEPLAMIEKTLDACARIRYPHTTYLLDDTRDRRFRDAAVAHGAVPLELLDVPGAKAGKINHALAATTEEFVLVLDPDHVPFPEFLDRVLGHFGDPRVGFVQVAQAYYNQHRSFIAAGAAEQTYAFYGPGLIGLHGHRAAVAIGANCTFRRKALESIGGHGIGLAEDLVTAIRLHAAGWRSIYVPEILSRGLVPEDLGSFLRQQLKWSRGVYEVLLAELAGRFRGLRWRQRLAYLAIGTYYLSGPTTLVYLVLPYLYLWTGVEAAHMRLDEFVTRALPVGSSGVAMYLFAQRWLCDPARERGLHLRGLLLKIGNWPTYVLGTVLAIVRADVPYVPTAKQAVRGHFLRLAAPHLVVVFAYGLTLGHVARVRLLASEEALTLPTEAVWGMVAFATVPALASIVTILAAWRARRPLDGAAWEGVDVRTIGGPA